MKKLEF